MTDIERPAIMEFEGNMPREWADSLARICSAQKPSIYADDQWAMLVEDACHLMRHIPKFQQNGWSQADIKALLPHLRGRRVSAVGMGDVIVSQGTGPVKIYRRPDGIGGAFWSEGKRG